MISINATLVIQVINFLVLAFILNRLMFQPILKLINERSQHIETTKNDIKDTKLETERLKDEYLSRQNEASKDAAQKRAQIRGTAINKAEEYFNNSRKQVASARMKADKEAEKKLNKEQPLLNREAATLADDITEKMIGRRIAT